MTLESHQPIEFIPRLPSNETERLLFQREYIQRRMARVSVALNEISQEYNDLILQSIEVNRQMKEAGIDTGELTKTLQPPHQFYDIEHGHDYIEEDAESIA